MAGGAGANRARQSYNEDSGRTDQPQQHRNMSGQGGPAPYDGPASQTSSQQGDQTRQNPFPPGPGYDPAKPATAKPSIITNTRVELPVAAYALDTNVDPSSLPQRPGTSTAGKAVQIRVNQFKVTQWPTKDVYQYDVLIGGGDEKRGKILKVWNSKTLQGKLRALTGGMPWLWDGNKIAWTSYNVPEQRCLVNLDAEQGRQPRASGPDEVFCIIRPTKSLRMACLGAYLNKQIQFDNSVLESINFLDHLMRMGPSQTLLSFKRSFFARGQERCSLDKCIDAMRGVYTSIRLCSPKPSAGGPATGLALNVDVANGTFWAAQDLHQAARNLCKSRNRGLSYQVFQNLLRPTRERNREISMSEDFKELRKLTKLKFWVKHRGKAESEKEYTILKFTFSKDEQFFDEGVHSKNYIFKMTDKSTNPPTERDISVYDYFKHKYNIRLEFPFLPLVQTSRAGVFPMEVCVIKPNQKYAYKLDGEQTSAMIKFAVTRPKERLKAIAQGVGMLKWNEDSYLSHYGLRVDPNLTVTQARVLPPPEVQYNGSIAKPGFSGRWDLRGKKFLYPNKNPLQSWGICVIGECVQEAALKHFVQVLVQTYISHGGRVTNKNPHLFIPQKVTNDNLGKAIDVFHTAIGQICKATPQILLFVVPLRDSFLYERLKKNSECRFGQFSQVLNKNHVLQASPQYCSNVCMKLNAKLGGTSCRVADVRPPKPFFNRPTMIIGADVSHPTPGSPQGSMAAITMSWDREACRYAAAVQTNGYRAEMITPANIKTIFMMLYDRWVSDIGGGNGPQHIYYFRDGVSEGQYLHVLKQEVSEMKNAISQKFPQHNIRWTVTICTKRHHIRFFPKEGDSSAGDRNNNPLPGTLVEHDVTHPFEYDFYLCSHVAIQGTARPVHYHVILDEANVPVNDFQRLIYNMCYQYMRSTTPVSLFPAVYYAHLASNRARAHENRAASEGAAGGQKFEERRQDTRGRQQFSGSNTGSGSQLAEPLPLMPMGDLSIPAQKELIRPLRLGMWYI